MATTFHNLSNEDLADEIGTLNRQAKDIGKRLDAAKAEFKGRRIKQATGRKYEVNRVEATRWSLDAASIKQEMGEAWANARSKVSAVVSVTIGAA